MQDKSITARSALLLLGTATLGSIVLTAPALADAPAVPPPAPAFSWTGVYVGASVGHSSVESTWNGPAGAGEFGGADTDALHSKSATYGGQIGYNYQVTHGLLVGLEASLHGTDQSAANSYTGGEGYTGATGIAHRTKFGGDVSARFGVTFDRVLAYGKAGIGFAHYDYSGMDNAAVTYEASTTRSGVLVGGGLEYAIARHWSIKAEYNHLGFTTKTVTLTSSGGANITVPIGGTDNMVFFGVNYRF